MPLDLDRLEQAACTLGLMARRHNEMLDVRLTRPNIFLRIRPSGSGFEAETWGKGLAANWLRMFNLALCGAALGFLFMRTQRLEALGGHSPPHYFVSPVLYPLIATALLLLGMEGWIAFLTRRTRQKLFSRAWEMEWPGAMLGAGRATP